jgi:hypothetical protein
MAMERAMAAVLARILFIPELLGLKRCASRRAPCEANVRYQTLFHGRSKNKSFADKAKFLPADSVDQG